MPHVTIKHFPADLSPDRAQILSEALTSAVVDAFGCAAAVVSIALEPVAAQVWDEQVYQPQIARHPSLLKRPEY
ncbi:MAG: tautomerase family protein [Angustibacter sp.]